MQRSGMATRRHPIRRRTDQVLSGGLQPRRALVLGIAGVVLIGLLLGPNQESFARATQALILVVPVICAAVLGGRWVAYVVAAAATVEFSLLVPPFGSLRVELQQDVIALIVFLLVAVLVSMVVARRIELLGEVERQRALLLRSVSHDLRTPLSTIRAASSELLDGGDHDPATRHRLLQLVSDESDRLDRLVSNLLNLSRIEAGALQPRRQSIDVAELIGFCTARLDRLFIDRTLTVDVADDLPFIEADHTQLDQVLTNLLENAARHSPPGGEVIVSARAEGRQLVIAVSDDGPGVDPAQAELLFQPFRSGTIAGSSGIGLAICKAVVDAHHGEISVAASPDGGARFVVSLPI